MAADEVLPRIRECVRGRLDVAGGVLGQVREVDGRPTGIDDVDQRQRVVVGQVDDHVVGRVVRPCHASSIRSPPISSVRLSWNVTSFGGGGPPWSLS